ncbi:MAG: hypothetical protein G01um101472_587 [Parcubacteria group bacterium Gr01-1014_72]|nr:MAG: hypothetical protein G01um101472_587 [Parcubacteria group bacterium Gr01-1014_72]
MIEITTALFLLAQTFYGAPTAVSSVDEAATPKHAFRQEVQEVIVDRPLTLEGHVRESFQETPVLAEIARCESRFRQFDSDGEVLRGARNKGDVGLMQINEYYHGEKAKELRFDIHSLEGNITFAKWLHERYGDAPWVHSSKCWRPSQTLAVAKAGELASVKN